MHLFVVLAPLNDLFLLILIKRIKYISLSSFQDFGRRVKNRRLKRRQLVTYREICYPLVHIGDRRRHSETLKERKKRKETFKFHILGTRSAQTHPDHDQ